MSDKLISDLTDDSSPSPTDLVETLKDPSGSPSSRKVELQRLGRVVQVVNTQTGAVATGTTVIPLDNTIPQNTEGNEFMTLAITPTSASNKLKIEVVLFATSNAGNWITAALFQDSTANALAALSTYNSIAGGSMSSVFTHYMTAGTTLSTTFKVRAGRDASAGTTITFNGAGGARYLGGVMASSITITEIIP